MTMFRKILVQAIAIFSIILLLGTGCNKAEEPATYDVWLPKTIKDIFLVQPGTYWVMEEAASGGQYIDSVFVIETIHDTVDIIDPGSHLPFAKKERFRVKCISPFYGYEFDIVTESADLVNDMNRVEPCFFVAIENFNGAGERTARSRIYYYPDVVDGGWNISHAGLTEPKVRIDSVLATYTLRDLAFSNVRKVDTEMDSVQRNTRSVRYITPEAGIIQTKLPDFGIDWFMIRSKIVR